MDNLVRDIVIITIAISACVRWWFIAKEATSRRYILLLGVCVIISVISHIIRDLFNVDPLMAVSILAFLGFIYFFIKALLSERRAKKKSLYD